MARNLISKLSLEDELSSTVEPVDEVALAETQQECDNCVNDISSTVDDMEEAQELQSVLEDKDDDLAAAQEPAATEIDQAVAIAAANEALSLVKARLGIQDSRYTVSYESYREGGSSLATAIQLSREGIKEVFQTILKALQTAWNWIVDKVMSFFKMIGRILHLTKKNVEKAERDYDNATKNMKLNEEDAEALNQHIHQSINSSDGDTISVEGNNKRYNNMSCHILSAILTATQGDARLNVAKDINACVPIERIVLKNMKVENTGLGKTYNLIFTTSGLLGVFGLLAKFAKERTADEFDFKNSKEIMEDIGEQYKKNMEESISEILKHIPKDIYREENGILYITCDISNVTFVNNTAGQEKSFHVLTLKYKKGSGFDWAIVDENDNNNGGHDSVYSGTNNMGNSAFAKLLNGNVTVDYSKYPSVKERLKDMKTLVNHIDQFSTKVDKYVNDYKDALKIGQTGFKSMERKPDTHTPMFIHDIVHDMSLLSNFNRRVGSKYISDAMKFINVITKYSNHTAKVVSRCSGSLDAKYNRNNSSERNG